MAIFTYNKLDNIFANINYGRDFMKISELLGGIKAIDIVLPEFQREYVWSKDQAKKLLASLVKEFPVGSLLFWKTNNPPELKNIRVLADRLGTTQIILDGQQRLTTLYMLITGEIPPFYCEEDIQTDPRDLFFNIHTGEFQYYQANLMKSDPLWFKVVDCFNPSKLINVFKLAEKISKENAFDLAQTYNDNLTKLRNVLNDDLPMQIVPPSANLVDAIDIFDLVNSQGTKLTDAELALTHVTGKWPQARRIIKEKIENLKKLNFDFDLTFMTRSLTTIVSKRALYETIHKEPKEKLMAGWDKLTQILDYLLSILPDRAFIHSTNDMSTTNVLVPIISYLSQNNGGFPDDKNLKRAIYFIYLALTWSRYSGQTDQRLEYDVSIVNRENNPWENLTNALIDQRGRVEVKPNDLEGRTASHPLYLITHILMKSQGAIDWFNGIPLTAQRTGAYYVHSHHIFPTSLLYENGYDLDNHLHRKIVNEIANRAFLSAESNIKLSNKPPETYLLEIEAKYPGALVKQFIPMQPELWKINRYADFLEARRILIAHKLNDYFNSLITEPIDVKKKSVLEIIKLGESTSLEFKSTLQWDLIKNVQDKQLRKSVLKSITAFLNSYGGTLVIGVDDIGGIIGLDQDLSLTEKSEDKFLNLLNSLISESIGAEFAGLIKTRIEVVENKKVCIVDIDRSSIPTYLTLDGKKEFFVRMNNTTRSLDVEDTAKYISINWS